MAELFCQVHALITGSGIRDTVQIKNLVQAQMENIANYRLQFLKRTIHHLAKDKIQSTPGFYRTVDQFRGKTPVLFFQLCLPQHTVQSDGRIGTFFPNLQQYQQGSFPSVHRNNFSGSSFRRF